MNRVGIDAVEEDVLISVRAAVRVDRFVPVAFEEDVEVVVEAGRVEEAVGVL